MTPSEFKAWFEGFCEGIDGAPSKEQFERIKERVEKIADSAPAPVGDRYYLPLTQPRVFPTPYWESLPINNTTSFNA